MHNSSVRSWKELTGDDFIIIGGYESGMDAASNLSTIGKKCTVVSSTAFWNIIIPNPSTELAPYTAERIRRACETSKTPPRLLAPLRVHTVEKVEKKSESDGKSGYIVKAKWGVPIDHEVPEAAECRKPPLQTDHIENDNLNNQEEATEIELHTPQRPILCTRFMGSVISGVAKDLFVFGDPSKVKAVYETIEMEITDDEEESDSEDESESHVTDEEESEEEGTEESKSKSKDKKSNTRKVIQTQAVKKVLPEAKVVEAATKKQQNHQCDGTDGCELHKNNSSKKSVDSDNKQDLVLEEVQVIKSSDDESNLNVESGSKTASGCLAGSPLLNENDESIKTPGLFLLGPSVRHGYLSFCFVYKFRQRFGVVSAHIAKELGRDKNFIEETVKRLRDQNMYLDDFECCEGACGKAC